ncbi:NAD-dependent epimerase/dehydratase family protein [Candidatus Pacearchaeota archaeon]|jgi:UDP-glucose 4-epimerase|nr:NAD-dependent epimerase/dehydratase family protein [Candidatus Pacearchaeota archaeon]
MKVLVTGAGGFIGSHLVDKLKSKGHYVIGLDRKCQDDWSVGQCIPDFPLVMDIRHCMESRVLFRGSFDVCFHLAAESRIQPSFKDPLGCVADNVMGTANVLQLCVETGARMIYAGSSTADDDVSKNVYATSKYQGEQLCQTWLSCFGLPYHIARFYNVYGERQEEEGPLATVIGIWEKQYREGLALTITGTGTQRRDFTHVSDIVDGLYAIWETDPNVRVHSLGTNENHGLYELASMFNAPIKFIPRPPGESDETRAVLAGEDLNWKAQNRIVDYVQSIVQFHGFGWGKK